MVVRKYYLVLDLTPIITELWTLGSAVIKIRIQSFSHSVIHSFIHSVVCLTTGQQPLPVRVLHRVQSSASSFNFQYLILSVKSSSSCLRLLPCIHVTSVPASFFPSTVCLEDSSYARFNQSNQSSICVFYVGCSFPP